MKMNCHNNLKGSVISGGGAWLLPPALLMFVGCATPMQDAVRTMAPGYRPKAPASSDDELGRHLVGNQPATNACFAGDPTKESSSWNELKFTYKDVLDTEFSIDLGKVVQVPADVGIKAASSRSATVILQDLAITKLNSLYINANSACVSNSQELAAFDRPGGAYMRVLTKAIRAGTVTLEESNEISGKLNVDVVKLGNASVGPKNQTSRTWNGASLFFADYSECFNVMHKRMTCSDVGVGSGDRCNQEPCTVTVNTVDPGTSTSWTATISCPGSPPQNLGVSESGGWVQYQASPGVTYNVRVQRNPPYVGVKVDFDRWIVASANDDACH